MGSGNGGVPPQQSSNVTTASLVSFVIVPHNTTVPVGLARTLTVTGTYSDGTRHDISSTVAWSSSDAGIATVSSTGAVTPLTVGTVVITATQGSVSASTKLIVDDSQLTAVAVTPDHPSIPTGLTKQLTATATYSSGISYDVTSLASWLSSSTSVATVDAGGTTTAVTTGTSDISAEFGGMTHKVTLTASSARLQSLSISQGDATVPAGGTIRFTAQGTYSDGTTQDVTEAVSWGTGDSSIAVSYLDNGYSESPPGGFTGLSGGATVVTATLGGVSAYVTLKVTGILNSIQITGSSTMLPERTQKIQATAVYTNGTIFDITSQVTWASSSTDVATITGAGDVTTYSVGSVDITATLGNMSGKFSISVEPAKVVSISLIPNPINIFLPIGESYQLAVTARYDDETVADITHDVTWSSSSTSVATVSSTGLVTSVATGNASIKATLGGLTQHLGVFARDAVATSLSVTPLSPTLPVGLKKQLTATAMLSDNTTQDVTRQSSWSSSDTSMATVDPNGLVTLLKQGAVTIYASYASSILYPEAAGATDITIGPATIQSVRVLPASPMVANGGTQQFTASVVYSDGTTQDISSSVTWSSSNAQVVGINSSGLASVVGNDLDTADITATYDSFEGTTTLTTSSLPVTPNAVSLQLDTGHSGYASWDLTLTYPGAASWSVDTGSVIGAPLIANGRVFVLSVGAVTQELRAIDEATGTLLWGPVVISTTVYSNAGIAYDDGRVFALNTGGMLQAYDAVTGKPQWSVMLNGEFYAPPAAANGLVYAGVAEVKAVDQATGTLVWYGGFNGTYGTPAVVNTTVYLSPTCADEAINSLNRVALWSRARSSDIGCSEAYALTPSVNANNIMFSGGIIYDGLTGSVLGSYGGSVMPALDAVNAYVMGNSTLQSMAISNQQINWSFAGDGKLASAPIEINKTIFIGSSSGNVYALSADDGTQLWTTTVTGSVVKLGLSAADGFLIVSTDTGITAFRIAP